MTFYENFVALCALKNKTPSAVVREIGLSRTSATGWKNGKVPSNVNLNKIAMYFGVNVSDLIEFEDDVLFSNDTHFVYKKFLDLCSEAQTSPSKVAVQMGLSSAAPTGWRQGKKPSKKTIQKIAQYFNVPVSYFSEDPEKEKSPIETTMGESKKALVDLCLTLNEEEAESMLKLIEVALAAVRNNKNG